MNLSIVTKEIFGQNEMNIYQSDEKDVFMTREQIGQALDYKNPRRAIADIHSRNKERLDKFSGVSKLRTPQGIQETYIYNEQGIYEIIRKSGQQKADDFYDWVYSLLSKLRKGELEVRKPMSQSELALLQAQNLNELEQRVENHDSKIVSIEKKVDNQITLSYGEQRGLQKAIARRVYELYENPEERPKGFSGIHREIKDRFAVASYKDVRKKDLQNAINYVGHWIPRREVI
ncbi:MAG TPA: ORF6C domain-containing protein [Pseudogracilibacillus sp.]|nr:ORF6C domain-containing protein [Pseudogracilibacillus sp.]